MPITGEMVVSGTLEPNKKRMKKRFIIANTLVLLCFCLSLTRGQEQNKNRDYQYALIEAVRYKNLGNLPEAIKRYGQVIKAKPDCANF